VLSGADFNPRSSNAAEHTIKAVIHDNRMLGAGVRYVDIRMFPERFNMAMALNDRPHLRLHHVDLDIDLDTAIDGRICLLLYCFRDQDPPVANGN
jgi:hypothetical protein